MWRRRESESRGKPNVHAPGSGRAVEAGSAPQKVWTKTVTFHMGDAVHSEDDPNHWWVALSGGTSGQIRAQPPFEVIQLNTVIEPKTEICDATGEPDPDLDKCTGLKWLDAGVIRPIGLIGNPLWTPVETGPDGVEKPHEYKEGDVVFAPGVGGGRYYTR
jgi:hypothetical protein